MKKKFKLLMTYFKSAGLDEVSFQFDSQGGGVEYSELKVNFSVATPIENIFEEILEMYVDQVVEEGESEITEEGSDYYQIFGTIYVTERKIVFEGFDYTYYGSETSGMSYEKDDYEEDDSMYNTFEEVDKILTELNIDKMIVGYSGGGDSGYIDGDYKTEDGQSGSTPAGIEDICYDLLQEYGGWEINEGSQGTITFTKDFIEVEHEWNTEENDSVDLDITVDENSFNEQ
jgi:hypothetical protein